MPTQTRDFFISFTGADRDWAAWIAWTTEEAGYSVWFQDWDFRGNFVLEMDRAHTRSRRTIAVLSPAYFESRFAAPEWAARFAEDGTSANDLLVPVRVVEFHPEGLMKPIIYVDFVGADAQAAKTRLIHRLSGLRRKPTEPPLYPGQTIHHKSRREPKFPTRPQQTTFSNLSPSNNNLSFHDDEDCTDMMKEMFNEAATRLQVLKDLLVHGLIEDDHRRQFEIQIIEKYVVTGQKK